MKRLIRNRLLLAGLPAISLLAACGGGGDDDAAAANDTAVATPESGEAADSGVASDDSSPNPGTGSAGIGAGVANSDGGSPLEEESDDGDNVQFVTTPSTTTTSTTTTTTIPPTTSTSTTTTTSTTTSTTTTTSTSTTVPAPTTIRCSFAADALFEPGEAVLTEQAILDLGNVMTGIDDVRTVRVEGHTDHRGSDASNLALSQARADAAAAALVDAGIDESLITAVGLGETDAHQGGPTDDEMAGDRRVDVVIDADVPITTTC